MKKLIYAIIVMISLSMVACHPDDVATKYDNPNWTYTANTDFNVNMTATIQLPSNILPYLMEDDQMVALVREEIRGVAKPYDNGLFFITIRGSENEISNITFRYWSAKTSYMYETTDVIPFEENAILGTPDEPFIPTFQIKQIYCRMKKFIYSLMLSCIVVTTAVAQEEVYNWFGTAQDDWFVDLNVGGDVLFNQYKNDIIANNGVGANLSVSAGKWIMPYFATRLQIKSLMWRGAASAENMSNWEFDIAQFAPYSDGSCNYNLFYLNPHIDLMLSLYSCIYGGYKASQKWDIIPFIGMGYAHVFSGKGVVGGDCMTGNFGLQGKYRINNNWDINLELQTSILPDYYTNGAGKVTQEDLAFTIGATYNIGGHTFSQHAKKAKEQKASNKNGKDTVVVYNNTERIIERGAPASNGNLEQAAKSGKFNQAFQIALIEFALGSDQPKQNYETQYYNVATFVNAYPNVKLRLDAYCDKDTGTEEVNARLAERRANTVRNILVNNYGIPEDIITLNPIGSAEQVYEEGELNRIVRITALPE